MDLLENDIPKYTVVFYEEFCQTIRDYNVGFFSAILLFLLTLASWFSSRQKEQDAGERGADSTNGRRPDG